MLHQDAGINLHRARMLARSIAGTSLHRVVLVFFQERLLNGDPGSWRNISRRRAMRCRGVVVRWRLGHRFRNSRIRCRRWRRFRSPDRCSSGGQPDPLSITPGAILQYYADNGEIFLSPRPLKSIAGEAHIEYSPLGVLIGVQPWNYPYYQLARFAAPHLTSGNVMLVKHAPGVPQCAVAFEQLLAEAGAPRGTYTNVFLSNDQVAKLIDDPRTRGVALTGSERAGESLAARAGKNLKKSTMELGGSDAFIVLEDYDLEDAVKMAVVGRIGNTGQTCIGAKRFIFVGSRINEFLEMFRAALESLKVGDPFDETVTLGPVSSENALNLLLKQTNEAVAYGAKILTVVA